MASGLHQRLSYWEAGGRPALQPPTSRASRAWADSQMRAMNDPNERTDTTGTYRPIDCSLHDELESLAVRRLAGRIRYRDEAGHEQEVHDRIADIFASEGAEYLRLSSGETIRLDRLLQVEEGARQISFGTGSRADDASAS